MKVVLGRQRKEKVEESSRAVIMMSVSVNNCVEVGGK